MSLGCVLGINILCMLNFKGELHKLAYTCATNMASFQAEGYAQPERTRGS
jgi:hypothetical protein